MLSIKENVYKYLLPNLLEIQRISFCWFLEKGLVQEFEDFSLIRDYLGELELNLSTKFYKIKSGLPMCVAHMHFSKQHMRSKWSMSASGQCRPI